MSSQRDASTNATTATPIAVEGCVNTSEVLLHVQDIKVADWSQEVAPFWGAVIKSALSTQGFSGLFKAGWTTIKVKIWLRCLVICTTEHILAVC